MPRMCPPGFLPATGRLDHLRFGEGARADTGVGPGDEISPWYDPMIAKLIVHGATRDHRAEADGPRAGHDRGGGGDDEPRLPASAGGHGRFASGDVDTGLIEADLDALVTPPPTPPPSSRGQRSRRWGSMAIPRLLRASACGRRCGRACV
jgi:3-methylcrotonyl-CoA carboxylase alpha subunit